MKHPIAAALVFLSLLLPPPAGAQPALSVVPLTEKKVAALPAGPLFWRIETFSAMDEAQRAAGATAMVAEAAGKVWLFTLGPSGGASPGGTKVAASVGWVQPIAFQSALLKDAHQAHQSCAFILRIITAAFHDAAGRLPTPSASLPIVANSASCAHDQLPAEPRAWRDLFLHGQPA